MGAWRHLFWVVAAAAWLALGVGGARIPPRLFSLLVPVAVAFYGLWFAGVIARHVTWLRQQGPCRVLSRWEDQSLVVFVVSHGALGLLLWWVQPFTPSIPGPPSLAWIFGIASFCLLWVFHFEILQKIEFLSRGLLRLGSGRGGTDGESLRVQVRTEQDLIREVQRAHREGLQVRALASKNSSPVYREATKDGVGGILLELDSYNRVIDVDRKKRRVTVQSGMSQGDFVAFLQQEGWAVRALNGSHHLTVGGTLATGSFCASRFTFNEAVVQIRIIEADGTARVVGREGEDSANPEFGAYLCSLGVLGVISTITFQCVDEYSVKGQSVQVRFDQMLQLTDDENTHYLKDWDYLVCEWYPRIDCVISRRSKVLAAGEKPEGGGETAKISAVGPSESYFAQVLTWVANGIPVVGRAFTKLYLKFLGTQFSDGPWQDRICADPKLDLAFHPIEYIEVVVRQRDYAAFMEDLRVFYETYPDLIPYCPVISDWIASDQTTWIGKNAVSSGDDSPWFCAITVMHQRMEASNRDQIFAGPIALGRKYNARMHWGKNPWMESPEEVDASLPAGHFQKFLALRRRVDPDGIFLNPFFTKILGASSYKERAKEQKPDPAASTGMSEELTVSS